MKSALALSFPFFRLVVVKRVSPQVLFPPGIHGLAPSPNCIGTGQVAPPHPPSRTPCRASRRLDTVRGDRESAEIR
jgi:hypothetical protein